MDIDEYESLLKYSKELNKKILSTTFTLLKFVLYVLNENGEKILNYSSECVFF